MTMRRMLLLPATGLLLVAVVAFGYLMEPIALRSFTYSTASNGCGDERARAAVAQALDAEETASEQSYRPLGTYEVPGRVVAEAFALVRQEDRSLGLFEYNLRKSVRGWALRLLVERETLIDAFCSLGPSGRTPGGFGEIAEVVGLSAPYERAENCEIMAAAWVFVELDSPSNDAALRHRYQEHKTRFCHPSTETRSK